MHDSDRAPTPRLDALIATHGVVAFRPALVDIAGDVVAGLLLSQLLYWLPRAKVHRDGRSWVVKADSDWWDECRITENQARRARKALQDRGLITSETWKWHGSPKTHIAVVPGALERQLEALGSDDLIRDDDEWTRAGAQVDSCSGTNGLGSEHESLETEITTETLTEKEHPPAPVADAPTASVLELRIEQPPEPAKPSFQDFYDAYGKKVQRFAAEKAWKKALKAGADPDRIVAAAHAYRSGLPPDRRQYQPYPSRWLNAGGWMDEFEPPPLTLQEQRAERDRRAEEKAAIDDERRATMQRERDARLGVS